MRGVTIQRSLLPALGMGPPGYQARILTANPGLLEDEAKCSSWRPPPPDQSLPFLSSKETGVSACVLL